MIRKRLLTHIIRQTVQILNIDIFMITYYQVIIKIMVGKTLLFYMICK